MTLKRIKWLILLYTFYPLLELIVWVSFLIDEIFFKDYHQETINQPVFIIGTPRSGSTFLQRLMAKDDLNFTSMVTWEIFLAPSIIMRKIIKLLTDLDNRLGKPLNTVIMMLEKKLSKKSPMHKISLCAPEEDDYLLLHIWSNLKVWLFAAMLEDAIPYAYFDKAIPEAKRDRILTFYKHCIQRHLYTRDNYYHYLSKNPHFTPMTATLLKYFPDAKIIYLVRNPFDMIPSLISMKDYEWNMFGNPLEKYACRNYVLNVTSYWYTYPLEILERTSQNNYVVINFRDLTKDPKNTIIDIYNQFGLEINPSFSEALRIESKKARHHKSKHDYSLSEMGLSHEEILNRYTKVFDKFDFNTHYDYRQRK